jgi:lysophospholipase L1-like esterase
VLLIALAACGSKDPFAGGDDASAPDGQTSHVDGSPNAPDAAPVRSCAAAPKRVVVLGDSITACSVAGGPTGTDCVSKQFSDYVIAHYGPDATYENHAVGGAVLADIAGQLQGVQTGSGPVLFMIYIGGNDLAPYIFQSDDAATQAWANIRSQMDDVWHATFSSISSRFAAGSMVVMNTQYNPFDDCTAPPYNVSSVKADILHQYNDELRSLAAAAGDEALLVDQFTPFLGHGHHYDVATCPHYQAGAEAWMKDLIHANAPGNAELSKVLNAGADRLYRDCN